MNTVKDLRQVLSQEVRRLQPSAGLEARVLKQALRSSAVDQAARTTRGNAIRPWVSGTVATPRMMALIVVVLVLAIVATLIFGAGSFHPKAPVPAQPNPKALIPGDPIPPSVAANGWIAYSTDGPNPGSTDITTGSDIYLVRAGVKSRLVAGRDSGSTRNMCPNFSPDGRRLAYGVDGAAGRAVVVLWLDSSGAVADTVRFKVPGSGSKVCPRWSADGKRIAYLEGGSVVVRGLDGSTLAAGAGDPGVKDFGLGRQYGDPLLSPKGDRIAWLRFIGVNCQIVISRPDRTAARVVPQTCGNLVAWSPDGRQILRTQDVGGIYYSLDAIAVDSPFPLVTLVSSIRTNGARSSPGWGDVSWQPIPPSMPAGDAALNAGTYSFEFSQLNRPGKPFPKVLITVPGGWNIAGGLFVNSHVGTERQIAVSFWNVVDVYADGCRWLSRPKINPGPTVDELAKVLAARQLRSATAPVAISLGGYDGMFLEWSVPIGIKFSQCDQDPNDGVRYFESWTGADLTSPDTTDRYQQEPGQVDMLWILDIEGRRLVIDAAYWPGSTDKDRADLQRVVNSIAFQP